MKPSTDQHEKLKQDVFRDLCNSAVCIMNYRTSLMPTTHFVKKYKVSRYLIRKIMSELKNEGLVKSGCDSWYSSYLEQQIIARGFTITKKATNTEVFIKAQEYENKLIEEIFEGEIE